MFDFKTSTDGFEFGSVLKESVTVVEECPRGEEQWREAAERKDCAKFAYNLSKPKEFLYHCVINSYFNQTVELCAKERLVHLGFCAEYSFSANKIQGSLKVKCNDSSPQCPIVYNSTQAYRYQGCYHLSKKNQTKEARTNVSADLKALFSVIVLFLMITVYCSKSFAN